MYYEHLLGVGCQPGRIAIAGDSAGGGLAVALIAALKERNKPLPAACVCLSPWVDLTCGNPSFDGNEAVDMVLGPAVIRKCAEFYLGRNDPRDPLASPLYAELKGFPPLLIQVGAREILHDDSLLLAERAERAGAAVSLEIWEGMPHVWQMLYLFLPEARKALRHVGRFIGKRC